MRLRLLGALDLIGDDGPVALPSAAQRRILTLLAVHSPATVPGERIADVCGVTSAAVRTSISRLRRATGEVMISTEPVGYALHDIDLDTHEFERELARAKQAGSRRAADHLQAALALWRGPALEEFASEDWARATAARLTELRAGASEERAGLLVELGEYGTAVAELTGLIAQFPLRERARELLMRACAGGGQPTQALREYQEFRRYLLDEIGTEPSATLRELDQHIAQGWRDVAPARSVVHASDRSSRLPVSTTSFVGRSREIDVLDTALRSHPLVTLCGTGGVGKTRLALEVARLADDWATDGAWLVELGSLQDGSQVAPLVASTLGIAPRRDENVAGAIASWMRATRALIVLDNCEHLIEDVAALVTRVLQSDPSGVLLATSREPLAVDGEHVIALGPLSIGVDGSAGDAGELFTRRAIDVDSQFDADADCAAILEICVRLDGIPLALELAAARVRTLTPREIVVRLDERFRLLTGGRRTATERHKTLRATVDWSYRLLDDEQRRCFERACAFSSPFELADAVAVIGGDAWSVLDSIGALVDRSLLTRTSDGRFRLLETLRSYAEERSSETGEIDCIRRTHAELFRTKAATAATLAIGPDERAAFESVVAQLPDYDAAMTWAMDNGDRETAAVVAFALFNCVMHRQLRTLTTVNAVNRLLTETAWDEHDLGWGLPQSTNAVVAGLNFAAGWSTAMTSDQPRARMLAARAVALDPSNSFSHGILSDTTVIMGETSGALDSARASVAAATTPVQHLSASLLLGFALHALARADDARAVASELRTWADKQGSSAAVAWSCLLLAVVDAGVNPQRALQHLDDGAIAARQSACVAAEHFLQRERLSLLLEHSLADARLIAGQVLTRSRETGDHGNLPIFFAYTIAILERLGKVDEASQIIGHLDLATLDARERRLVEFVVVALRARLGTGLEDLVRAGASASIQALLGLAIDALDSDVIAARNEPQRRDRPGSSGAGDQRS